MGCCNCDEYTELKAPPNDNNIKDTFFVNGIGCGGPAGLVFVWNADGEFLGRAFGGGSHYAACANSADLTVAEWKAVIDQGDFVATHTNEHGDETVWRGHEFDQNRSFVAQLQTHNYSGKSSVLCVKRHACLLQCVQLHGSSSLDIIYGGPVCHPDTNFPIGSWLDLDTEQTITTQNIFNAQGHYYIGGIDSATGDLHVSATGVRDCQYIVDERADISPSGTNADGGRIYLGTVTVPGGPSFPIEAEEVFSGVDSNGNNLYQLVGRLTSGNECYDLDQGYYTIGRFVTGDWRVARRTAAPQPVGTLSTGEYKFESSLVLYDQNGNELQNPYPQAPTVIHTPLESYDPEADFVPESFTVEQEVHCPEVDIGDSNGNTLELVEANYTQGQSFTLEASTVHVQNVYQITGYDNDGNEIVALLATHERETSRRVTTWTLLYDSSPYQQGRSACKYEAQVDTLAPAESGPDQYSQDISKWVPASLVIGPKLASNQDGRITGQVESIEVDCPPTFFRYGTGPCVCRN